MSVKNILKLELTVCVNQNGKYMAYFTNDFDYSCGSSEHEKIEDAITQASQALISCGAALLSMRK
jgi:hypothetical protein